MIEVTWPSALITAVAVAWMGLTVPVGAGIVTAGAVA